MFLQSCGAWQQVVGGQVIDLADGPQTLALMVHKMARDMVVQVIRIPAAPILTTSQLMEGI